MTDDGPEQLRFLTLLIGAGAGALFTAVTIDAVWSTTQWVIAGFAIVVFGFVILIAQSARGGGADGEQSEAALREAIQKLDARQVSPEQAHQQIQYRYAEREAGTPASRLGEAIKQTQIARRDATYDVGVTEALTQAEMLLRGARDRHDDLRGCGAARVAADDEEVDGSC